MPAKRFPTQIHIMCIQTKRHLNCQNEVKMDSFSVYQSIANAFFKLVILLSPVLHLHGSTLTAITLLNHSKNNRFFSGNCNTSAVHLFTVSPPFTHQHHNAVETNVMAFKQLSQKYIDTVKESQTVQEIF